MPAKFSFAQPASVHVWMASLEAGDDVLAHCESLLDPAEFARAHRFHFERDRRRFSLARGLLRQLLGRYLDRPPASVTFGAGPHGKPHLLAPAAAAVHFNLSHSGTRALFAFSPSREVGIDLEAGGRLGEDWPGLVGRIFSAREQAELAGLPPDRQRDAFLNGWTRKEAYLKATGQGLVNGLQQIEVSLDPARPAAFLSAELAAKWSLYDLRASAGMATALAVAGDAAEIKILAVADRL